MNKDHDLENEIPGYIRQDIAKEREAKLINHAWNQGVSDADLDDLGQENNTVSTIYKNAGLKKLS